VKSRNLQSYVNSLESNQGKVQGRDKVNKHMVKYFANMHGEDSKVKAPCPEDAFYFGNSLNIEQEVRLCEPFKA